MAQRQSVLGGWREYLRAAATLTAQRWHIHHPPRPVAACFYYVRREPSDFSRPCIAPCAVAHGSRAVAIDQLHVAIPTRPLRRALDESVALGWWCRPGPRNPTLLGRQIGAKQAS